MAKPTYFPSSFCLYLIFIAITAIPFFVHPTTLESNIQALLSLKNEIDPYKIPPSSFLHTWNFEVDPCESEGGQFLGVLCTIPLDNSSSSQVTVIDLDTAGYDGLLSPAIGNLTELTVLDLSKNKFRGQIPSTIHNLRKLTRISLSDNSFTGNLPSTIASLNHLEFLDLSQNQLSGSIPKQISDIRSLTLLRLSNNQFSGAIPDLAGLWQLNTLDLSHNLLYKTLRQLPINLRMLMLSHNNLTGHISALESLENLKAADLSNNRFSGSINRAIFSLPKLNSINVSTNIFTTMEVKNNSRGETQLRVLDVHGNHLRGSLPVNLVSYAKLTVVDLGDNQFSGRIPVEYGRKLGQEWRRLYLDHNFLVGNLPPQFNISTAARARGSLAQNCLKCPQSLQLCYGGQRPATQC